MNMITHVKTKGFKGFDIDEDIHPKTLFYGKNRSGKSTRSAAIALTLLGYIPFAAKTSKIKADILNDFGTGKTLTTAVMLDGVEFERHFSKSDKGTVSQRLRVDKKKYSAADFNLELFKAGNPKIIDVNDFMLLSDQKKIDVLFELFPPKADLKNLDTKIEKAKKDVSRLQKQESAEIAVVQRLTKSKSDIEFPAGSLAEIQDEISSLTAKVKDAQKNLKQAEIDTAVAKAEEKTAAESMPKEQLVETTVPADTFKCSDPGNQRIYDFVTGKDLPQDQNNKPDEHTDPVASIQKILDALNSSGCNICAAAIVAKVELRKFKKEVAA